MSDYTNKEMLDAIYEVRDRVTRIEEKLNRAEKLEDKVEYTHEKALNAKDIAEDALSLAQQNRESIKQINITNRWAWGLLVTALITVVAQFFGLGK